MLLNILPYVSVKSGHFRWLPYSIKQMANRRNENSKMFRTAGKTPMKTTIQRELRWMDLRRISYTYEICRFTLSAGLVTDSPDTRLKISHIMQLKCFERANYCSVDSGISAGGSPDISCNMVSVASSMPIRFVDEKSCAENGKGFPSSST